MPNQVAAEEERSRMLFSKLRQVVSQKFGYGVKEVKVSSTLLYKMAPGDFTRFIKNGAVYHIKRIYREIFTFRAETVNVTVHEGELKGRKIISALGKPYFRFQGIPYAKAPIGPLRFKDPEPPEPWKGVRSALKEGNIATQADIITGLSRGNEDCLFLNIFTPELPQEGGASVEGKAVLVWIHGGGFTLGSGNAEIYGPDFFLEEDVILITLNYRLGVLGFLSTGTEDAPGNAGLKDIVQALKWIQQNVAVFGGDPNKVTIFGESAGGAAVHYLMLSPLAKGLFQRAISQSGSALCPWAINEDPVPSAFKLGRAFGIETKDPKVLVEYLRKISPKVLTNKQTVAISEQNKRECIPFAFLPCVEPASYPNAFLSEHPQKLLEKEILHSDVPYILGTNEMEGMVMLKQIQELLHFLPGFPAFVLRHSRHPVKSVVDKLPPPRELDKDFERLVPRFLRLPYGSEKSKAAAEKIRNFYFDSKPFNKKTYKEYAELTTDTYFLIPILTTSKLQSKFAQSPVYKYQFLYDGNMGLLKKILNLKYIPGPVHADELGYLFHIPVLGPNLDPKLMDMQMTKKMVKLWTNFAKCGNPTPDSDDPDLDNTVWTPFSEDNQCFLVMNENFSMSKNINERRLKFWRDIKNIL